MAQGQIATWYGTIIIARPRGPCSLTLPHEKKDTIKRAYDKLKAKPSESDRRAALNTRLRTIMDKRVRYALEYKDLVMRAADLLESSIKVNLQALQADNDKRAMDVMTEERDEEIEAKKQELATGPFSSAS